MACTHNHHYLLLLLHLLLLLISPAAIAVEASTRRSYPHNLIGDRRRVQQPESEPESGEAASPGPEVPVEEFGHHTGYWGRKKTTTSEEEEDQCHAGYKRGMPRVQEAPRKRAMRATNRRSRCRAGGEGETMAELIKPEFNETLVIDNDHYEVLVQKVRSKLSTTGRFTHGRPILPKQQDPPKQWFQVVLQSGKRTTTVLCRADNIYVVGFQTQAGAWWEFGKGRDEHLIDGSTFLGYGGGYQDLLPHGADNLTDIDFGKNALTDAAETLATYSRNVDIRKKLVAVIVMLSESFRFESISKHLISNWRLGGRITVEMRYQVTKWEDISKALLTWDRNPTAKFPNLEAAGIYNALDATARIYLVKDVRVTADAVLAAMDGRPLVEVLAVRPAFDLRGTITAVDGRAAQCIYHRDVPVHHNQDAIVLSGPARAVSADVNFSIKFDLNGESDMQINWDVSETTSKFDEPLSHTLNTSSGPVEVIYAVLSNAVEAIVQVKLLTAKGDEPLNIYGKIVARSEKFNIGSVLFSSDLGTNVIMSSQQVIPLARSVVAVPLNSPLIIEVDLLTSSKDEIVRKAIQFDPKLSGEFVKNVVGMNGQIEVKITWLDYY